MHLPLNVELYFSSLEPTEDMTRAGYTLFVVRKAFQGIIGYLSHIGPHLHNTQPSEFMRSTMSVLTTLQLGLYGSYTCLFSAMSAWRLRNIWMHDGKYAQHPKPYDKKIMTTLFQSSQIMTDTAAFVATLLITTDMLNMTSAWTILIYSVNALVNLAKFGYKLGRTLSNKPNEHAPAEQINFFRYKRAHYSIKFGLSTLASLSLIPFFTLSAPYNVVTYLAIISVCSLCQIGYQFYGKTALQQSILSKPLKEKDEDIELTLLANSNKA